MKDFDSTTTPTRTLLIVNTLPETDTAALSALAELTASLPEGHVIHTERLRLLPCVGCNDCWLKTPGMCSIKDDYEQLLKAYLSYDAVVFLAGTAFGFVDYRMKNVIDRILPLFTMYTFLVDGEMRHVPRYDKKYSFGLLYAGEGDHEYLNLWMKRVMVNMLGKSLGAYPIQNSKEAISCIL